MVLIPPRRSPLLGLIAGVSAAALAVFALTLVAESSPDERATAGPWVLGGFLLATAGLLGSAARVLWSLRGGLVLDPTTQHVLIGTMGGTAHAVSVPLRDIARLTVSPRWETLRRRERTTWALDIETRAGDVVTIGEHEDPTRVQRVAVAVGGALDKEVEQGEFFRGSVPRPSGTWISPPVHLRTAWHLFGPVSALALFALVSGLGTIALADRSFLFGVVVAPFLLGMGLLLLLVVGLLTFGRERLVVTEEGVTHEARWGRIGFESHLGLGDKARVRVNPRGTRGTTIEIVTPTRALVYGNGLTQGTRPSSLEALATAAAISRALFGAAQPTPVDDEPKGSPLDTDARESHPRSALDADGQGHP